MILGEIICICTQLWEKNVEKSILVFAFYILLSLSTSEEPRTKLLRLNISFMLTKKLSSQQSQTVLLINALKNKFHLPFSHLVKIAV